MTGKTAWEMILHDDFDPEYEAFSEDEKDALLAAMEAVELAGPQTGRPHVDTLNGSKHANMKEMRYKVGNGTQIWRAAFAFDPQKKGIVLVAADKQGISADKFYKALIKKADERFDKHLARLKKAKDAAKSGTPTKTSRGK